MSSKIQAEIGLIVGYLSLLFGVLYWNLQPFHLLLSFIIEYASLLIVYLYISILLSKTFFDMILSTVSHLFSGLALGLVQGCFVMFMAFMLEGEAAFHGHVTDLPWLISALAVPMLILQFLAIRGTRINKDLQDNKMGELIVSAVTFPAVILFGMLAYDWSEEDEQIALTVVVLTRIIIEIWNNHFRKNKSSQKKIPA